MEEKKKNIFIRGKNKAKRIIKRFFTKQDFDKLTKDFFDMKAPVYDEEELEVYSEDSCMAVIDALEDKKYKSLLDIGCGTGHLISILSKNKKADYIGLDLSSKMVEEANKKKIKYAKFVEGKADNLPFDKKSFDIVTCSESFHHYIDPDKAMREAYRVLKKGGYYILADKDVGWLVWYHNFYNRRFKNTGDCNFSNLKRAKRLIQKNGFKLVYTGKYYNDTHYIVVGRK